MRNSKTTLTLFSIVFFVSSLLLVSCSKKDDTPAPKVYPEENFLPDFLEQTGFATPESSSTDIGAIIFRPKVKGKINSWIVKLPEAGTAIIQIWDVTTDAKLTTQEVVVASANTNTVKVITPIPLEKDKDYAIVLCGTNIYKYKKANTSTVAVTAGNIQVRGFMPSSGCPTSGSSFSGSLISAGVGFDTYIYGSASFNFQQTE
jgi:hypothetical protein